jgi:hypothetical protein
MLFGAVVLDAKYILHPGLSKTYYQTIDQYYL